MARNVCDDESSHADVAATAAGIADSASLMRWGFAADIVMIGSFLFVGLALHSLLKDVSRQAATDMLTLNAVSVAIMSANTLNHVAAVVVGSERYAGELGPAASGALATFFLDMHGIGYLVAQVFFGLYLIPSATSSTDRAGSRGRSERC